MFGQLNTQDSNILERASKKVRSLNLRALDYQLWHMSTGRGRPGRSVSQESTLLTTVNPVASTTPRGLPARGPRSAPGIDSITPTKVGTLTCQRNWGLNKKRRPQLRTAPLML